MTDHPSDAPSAVHQSVPLGAQWPTVDPFLFCVHHEDSYPAANDRYGPAASLAGRQIGMDFEGRDGWRMYHGKDVPGFPQHPHRGFETVTYARQGYIDHSDSIGATARFGRGDVQWMTAGAGVVHCEMFPLLDQQGPNPVELFQIWLNLPAEDKLVEPHFTMLWAEDIPKLTRTDPTGRTVEVTLIAGTLDGITPPPPPPHSWAGRADADVAIWHIALDDGATWELPPAAGPDTVRTLYVFTGEGVTIGAQEVGARTGNMIAAEPTIPLVAHAGAVDCLLLQGRPIGEPVARYGPFVMNTRAEIRQAIDDYQRTGFGGWPWTGDDPVHGHDGRFARHADGRVEQR